MASHQPFSLTNANGPGSAALGTAAEVLKPDVQTGCIQCGDAECCCLPIPCVVL
ncbi:hypothetical protein E4U54_004435, partial [Claviceps lovelessii]